MSVKLKNKKIIFLLMAVFLAGFLRISFLGASSLENDEAKTALGVDFPHSFLLPTMSVLSQDIFGASEAAARLPMALFGVLAVYLIYLLGKEIDERFALPLAFLFAALPVNVIFSRTALLDVPLSTAYIFVLLFFIKYEKEQSAKNIFLLFLGLLSLPFFKIQAVYFLASLFVYLLIITKGFFWRDKRFILMVLAFVPFFFYVLSQPQQLYDIRSVVTEQQKSTDVINFAKLLWQSWGILFLFSVLGFFSLLFSRKELDIKKQETRINILLITVFAVVFASLFSSPKNHYMTTLDAPVVILGAWFIFKILKTNFLRTVALVLIFINFFYLIFLTDNFSPYKNPSRVFWKNNAAAINSEIKNFSGNPIIFLDTNLSFTAKWYIRQETRKLDQLLNDKEILKDSDVAVVLDAPTLEQNKDFFADFEKNNFENVFVLEYKNDK